MISKLAKREYDRRYYLANAAAIGERSNLAYRSNPVAARARIVAWQLANPDKISGYRRKLSATQKERDRLKQYAIDHPDRLRAARHRWSQSNPEKRYAWRRANPEKVRATDRANVARRRAHLLFATPIWVTAEEKKQIRVLHAQAIRLSIERKEPYHVDHVIPLRGRKVRGLHVLANMQILRGIDNSSKANRYDC